MKQERADLLEKNNKPIKKNPIDKAQIGRKILKSNGQSEIKVKFELDKVNIEKNNSVGIVKVKVKILLIIFINYFTS